MEVFSCFRKRASWATRLATAFLTILLLVSLVNSPAVSARTARGPQNGLSNPLSQDDYVVVSSWGRSYLAENGQGKRLLYLEGDAYRRGYATGKLCPRSVYRMTHDFIFNMVSEMLPRVLGVELDPQAIQQLLRFIWPLCQVVVMEQGEPVTHNLGTGQLRVDQPLPPKANAPAATAQAPPKPAEAAPKRLTRLEQLRL
ncbi:MAG: hypothetical protein WHT46_05765, partial [Candidatus Geothermincolales bacterium]